MKGFAAFFKKEWMEQLRSYRLLILLTVLLLFGMASPLLAKLMPELFKNLSVSGITITMPAPTATDAWAQFFKNIGQMGTVVLLLLCGGSLSQELSRGTLIIPLSRGLSRNAVLLAKYTAALFAWTGGYVLAAAVCCAYTQYLFGGFSVPHLFFALACLWLFGAFLPALLLFTGAAVPGYFGGLVSGVLLLGILLALDAFPKLQGWNPVSLAAQSASLLTESGGSPNLWAAVWVTAGCTAACLAAAGLLFRRRG